MEVVLTDQVRDAIIALQGGNSSEFKSTIAADLMGRAMDAIEVQKVTAGQNFFNEPQTEQESDIDIEPEESSDEEV
jgi:hypothetical protein|tara:strand:- start:234 stop:461 length:228 start_codon:yes stop_codon:yes gene_type:complete